MGKPNLVFWLSATLLASALAHANRDGPPPGHTGAPGEQTCAAGGCHDMPSDRFGAISVVNTGPQHVDTIALRLTLFDIAAGPLVHNWGLQLTVLDSLNRPYGEIIVADSARTQWEPGGGGRIYLSHTAAGVAGGASNTSSWDFLWRRPLGAAVTNPFRIYVSGLLADGDGTAANDAAVTDLAVGPFCAVALTGDVDASTRITSADIIRLVGFIFKSGDPPYPCTAAGDVNCDLKITPADIIYLINLVFKSGPPPCDICPLILDGTWDC